MLHAMLRAAAGRGSYPGTVLADNPVAYWRLGEASGTTAVDEVGSNDGTYINSPTLGVTGAIAGDTDTAVDFDGSNEYVTAGDVLDPGLTDRTLEAWFKIASLPSSVAFVMSKAYAGGGAGRYTAGRIDPTTGICSARLEVSGSYVVVGSSASVVDGEWHHLVAVFDRSANLDLYLDGVLEASGDISAASATDFDTTWPFLIAAYADSDGVTPAYFFPGTIDEVAVYDTALSPARIEAHYNAGTT